MAWFGLKWATPAIEANYHAHSGPKLIFKELCLPTFDNPHHLLSYQHIPTVGRYVG
ncbi:hypothetical protein PCANC_18890 [Puccinia coronata f. sp. avenae]|uniref:Uncharacterized protein n=1 Tax=Puccinia coronata f. sp. avenae TaxID=200324 RepID=A0A2N5SNM8_9BASI|nr:hypothetical protein PCANC_18890 [Puccinia coronata f. sp. avenae]